MAAIMSCSPCVKVMHRFVDRVPNNTGVRFGWNRDAFKIGMFKKEHLRWSWQRYLFYVIIDCNMTAQNTSQLFVEDFLSSKWLRMPLPLQCKTVGAIIMRSNITWHFLQHCSSSNITWIRIGTHERIIGKKGLLKKNQQRDNGTALYLWQDGGQKSPWPFLCMTQWASSQTITLQWRHHERDGVSNHRRLHCLLNRWFRRNSKNISKLRVTGLCAGNSPWPVNSPHKGQ